MNLINWRHFELNKSSVQVIPLIKVDLHLVSSLMHIFYRAFSVIGADKLCTLYYIIHSAQ